MAKRRLLLKTEKLVAEYLAGASALQLAARRGCSLNVVLQRLREAGVQIRPAGERHTTKELQLGVRKAAKFTEIVDGLLLGDGCINNGGALQVAQAVRRIGWLRAIARRCTELGVANGITPERTPRRIAQIKGRRVRGGPSRTFYTHTYEEMQEQRRRWYPHGVKRVPRDVTLTALSVALWYCGDGVGHKNGTMAFCTQGFTRTEVHSLACQLSDTFGVHAYAGQTADGPVVRIDRRNDALKIKRLVHAYIPRCCAYKLKHIRAAIPRGRALRRLTPVQIRQIRAAHARGASAAALGRWYAVSNVTIINVLQGKIYRDVSGARTSYSSTRGLKLTVAQVCRIRSLCGKVSQKRLSKKFGVCQSTISRIQLGKIRKAA